jgi:predicted MFS family arabinose efflux permease
MFTSVAMCSLLAGLVSLRLPFIRLSSDLAPDPPGLKSFIETRAIGPASLIFITGAATCAISAYLAIYCQEVNLNNAAMFFMVSTIGTLSARMTTGRIYDRHGPMATVPPGTVILILSVLVLVLFPRPVPMTIASIFYGLGFATIFQSIQALTLSSVPAERRTAASAIFFICFDLGIGLGTLFLGLLAGYFATYRVVYIASPIFLVCMIILFFILFGGKKNRPRKYQARSKVAFTAKASATQTTAVTSDPDKGQNKDQHKDHDKGQDKPIDKAIPPDMSPDMSPVVGTVHKTAKP